MEKLGQDAIPREKKGTIIVPNNGRMDCVRCRVWFHLYRIDCLCYLFHGNNRQVWHRESKRSESGHEMDKTVAGAVEKDCKLATKEDDGEIFGK